MHGSQNTVDWLGLDSQLVHWFSPCYSNPLQLSASVDDRTELSSLMQQLRPLDVPNTDFEHNVDAVWNWLQNRNLFKRARREVVTHIGLNSSFSSQLVSIDQFESQLSLNITCENKHPKSVRSRLLLDEHVSKTTIERSEQERYARLIIEWIVEAQLPIVAVIQSTATPSSAWLKVFGSRRANTLRNRYHSWKPLRIWLSCNRGYTFPNHVQDMIDYLEDRCNEEHALVRCGKSIPGMIAAALHMFETVGMVTQPIHQHPLWNSTLQYWNTMLTVGRTSRKVAPMFPIAVLISMELFVVDNSQPIYLRALAWLWLVMHWSSLRSDDCQGLDPHRMFLTSYFWQGVLTQTKTSGPGKRALELPVFVSRQANFSGQDWLLVGFELWQRAPLNTRRDYFVMDADFEWSPKVKYLKPSYMNMYFREILRRLPALERPTLLKGWTHSTEHLMLFADVLPFWTGHSARHWAPSIAATLSISKEQRDFLGRWALGKQGGSNDYVLTSSQIVTSIQNTIAKSVIEGGGTYDETQLLSSISEFLKSRNAYDSNILLFLNVLIKSTKGFCLLGTFPTFDVLFDTHESIQHVETKALHSQSSLDVSDSSQGAPLYWISIQKRSGFRRLHKYSCNSCTASRVSCHNTEDVIQLKGVTVDAKCKICFPVNSKTSQEDSSSSASSSSSYRSSNGNVEQECYEAQQQQTGPTIEGSVVSDGSWLMHSAIGEIVHVD